MAAKRGRGRGRGKGKAKAEIVEDTPVEETPVDEAAAEETPVDVAPVEETLAEETAVEEMDTEQQAEEEVKDENMEETEESTEITEENAAKVETDEKPDETPEEATGDSEPTPTETKPENPYNTDKWNNKHADSLYLQVRGFPYDTTTEKMAAYFELSEAEFTGADIAVGIRGKPCGEFFFQATDEAVAVKVCGRHKELYGDTDSWD